MANDLRSDIVDSVEVLEAQPSKPSGTYYSPTEINSLDDVRKEIRKKQFDRYIKSLQLGPEGNTLTVDDIEVYRQHYPDIDKVDKILGQKRRRIGFED